ncbi:MAG: PmoA family protein [Acidobacteriota bacterium]|nr:PmoA family protein [Acidobacteriota bacterium]
MPGPVLPPQARTDTVAIVMSGFESQKRVLRRVAVLALLVWPPAGCAGPGQELPSGARVRVPEGIPEGWSSPVAAAFESRVPQGRVFTVVGKNPNGTSAQSDPETGILWLMGDVPAAGSHSVKPDPGEAAPAFRMVSDDQGYLVSEGDRPVLFYQSAPRSLDGRYTRAGYVHPLYGLDGQVLTHDFPDDHLHHRGIFWAWHQLWVGDEKAGDPWLTKDFLTEVEHVRFLDGPLFSVLEATALWTSPLVRDDAGELVPLVRERVRIQVFRSTPDSQVIDFHIRFRALVDGIRLGGSENPRGYSGFTVRVHASPDGRIHDQSGIQEGDRVGESSPWADYSGTFGLGGMISGIGMLTHPSYPEFPPRWLLRNYGMQNVAFPGRHPVDLPRGQPLDLRHRLVIHRGGFEEAEIALHQKVYEMVPARSF